MCTSWRQSKIAQRNAAPQLGGTMQVRLRVNCNRRSARQNPSMSASLVRREKAALSSGCKTTRQPLQPEAIGAVMEVTKITRPSISVSRNTVTARVCRTATRVNAEQSSKRTMRQADPTGFSGKANTAGANERNNTPSRCAGVVATACTQGKRTQHGKPQGVVSDDQPMPARDRPGALGWRRGS